MGWEVELVDEFARELREWPVEARQEAAAAFIQLKRIGPQQGRPQVDTLKGSKYKNMKELRFRTADGVWRIAFAFDGDRRAIMLAGGNKSGVVEKRFYRTLIDTADKRFKAHSNK